MKKLKSYGYKGKVECSKIFRLGSTNFRIDFTGGSITAEGVIPAKFDTSNIAYQAVIESSPEFKSGKIVITQMIDIEEDEPVIIDAVNEKTNENTTSVNEVRTAQDAREYLKANFGVKQSELQNAESVRNKAAELHIEFPNWD